MGDLNTEQIEALGLKAGKTNITVNGLGTSSYATESVSVPIMTIGKVGYHNPRFIALDLSHVERAGGKDGLHGLIGSTFLRKQGFYQADQFKIEVGVVPHYPGVSTL